MSEKIALRDVEGNNVPCLLDVRLEDELWLISATIETGATWHGEGETLFEAFRALRRIPESEGFRFLVAGARLNCRPTSMSAQAGASHVVPHYRRPSFNVVRNLIAFTFHRFAYLDIFAPAPLRKVGTVAEQDAYMDAWTTRALN
ncbi:hypothetical protein [Actinomadura atramentaria]|uniref:hypothetical protein n=1 Tax=Actinomadura atramentaria TaxID=1990 RepID=UPI0012FCA89D|nr:hypothetical protein [Actinomadura atramentaria]